MAPVTGLRRDQPTPLPSASASRSPAFTPAPPPMPTATRSADVTRLGPPPTPIAKELAPPAATNAAPTYEAVKNGTRGAVFAKGMEGPGVKELQDKLKSLGHPTNTDGKFTAETEAAVKAFQAKQPGMTPNGEASSRTLAALDAATSTPAFLQARYQTASVEVAKELNTRGVGFATAGNVTIKDGDKNPFWEKSGNGMKVRDGVKPSDAIADWQANSDKYRVDCAMGQKLFANAALLKTLGPEKFDAMWKASGGQPNITFGNGPGLPPGALKMNREDPKADPKSVPPYGRPGADTWLNKNLKPGDSLYFDNPDVTADGRARGLRGENAIFVGKNEKGENLYFAHGFGKGRSILTEKEVVDGLASASSTGEVYRMEEIYRPKF